MQQKPNESSDPVAEAFVEAVRQEMAELERDEDAEMRIWRRDRINRLVAFVRLRRSAPLVDLAMALLEPWVGKTDTDDFTEMVQRKGLMMHCLEILLRNGKEYSDLPEIRERDQIWLRELPADHENERLQPREKLMRAVFFVRIPDGVFYMGTKKGEANALYDEMPQHLVTVKGFWMQNHAVTNRELSVWKTSAKLDGRDQLDRGINYSQAADYAEWLGGDIPCEAEWEYACRAGTEGEYSFPGGAEELDKHAWYLSNAKNSTHGVGLLRGNAFGLFDMHGNIFEWCKDTYDPFAYGKRNRRWNARSWSEEDAERTRYLDGWETELRHSRVQRGGSWGSNKEMNRAANRFPGPTNFIAGLRVVLCEDGPVSRHVRK